MVFASRRPDGLDAPTFAVGAHSYLWARRSGWLRIYQLRGLQQRRDLAASLAGLASGKPEHYEHVHEQPQWPTQGGESTPSGREGWGGQGGDRGGVQGGGRGEDRVDAQEQTQWSTSKWSAGWAASTTVSAIAGQQVANSGVGVYDDGHPSPVSESVTDSASDSVARSVADSVTGTGSRLVDSAREVMMVSDLEPSTDYYLWASLHDGIQWRGWGERLHMRTPATCLSEAVDETSRNLPHNPSADDDPGPALGSPSPLGSAPPLGFVTLGSVPSASTVPPAGTTRSQQPESHLSHLQPSAQAPPAAGASTAGLVGRGSRNACIRLCACIECTS